MKMHLPQTCDLDTVIEFYLKKLKIKCDLTLANFITIFFITKSAAETTLH